MTEKKDSSFMTLSFAQSFNACIARNREQRLIISSPESMQLTHEIRSLHQAILVGIGTVLRR